MCCRWAGRFAAWLKRNGFLLVPLQSAAIRAILNLPEKKLLEEMRVVSRDGAVFSGADAFVYLAKAIPCGKVFYWIASLPGMAPLLRTGYRWIARNRTCEAGLCELPMRTRRAELRWFAWLPLFALTGAAVGFGYQLPPWAWMWMICFALFLGCKWLTFRRFLERGDKPRLRVSGRDLHLGSFERRPGLKFKVPIVRGTIDRRMLINFRVAPDVLQALLPEPFRVKTIRGWGMAGICLIRLKGMRPRFAPEICGLDSENAAHRIAVEWMQDGERREGVFIPRRDTSSRFQTVIGGRIFPGVHNLADFKVAEQGNRFHLAMQSRDGIATVLAEAQIAERLPETSVFKTMAEASEFFERGSLGYSVTTADGEFDGLELQSFQWQVEPLAVSRVESSFFADRNRFPAGSVEFDSALLMRGIEHEWHARGTLKADCGCAI